MPPRLKLFDEGVLPVETTVHRWRHEINENDVTAAEQHVLEWQAAEIADFALFVKAKVSTTFTFAKGWVDNFASVSRARNKRRVAVRERRRDMEQNWIPEGERRMLVLLKESVPEPAGERQQRIIDDADLVLSAAKVLQAAVEQVMGNVPDPRKARAITEASEVIRASTPAELEEPEQLAAAQRLLIVTFAERCVRHVLKTEGEVSDADINNRRDQESDWGLRMMISDLMHRSVHRVLSEVGIEEEMYFDTPSAEEKILAPFYAD